MEEKREAKEQPQGQLPDEIQQKFEQYQRDNCHAGLREIEEVLNRRKLAITLTTVIIDGRVEQNFGVKPAQ